MKSPSIPIILLGKEYWDHVIDFEFLKEEDVIEPNDLDMLTYVDNAQEAWEAIIQWHKNKGSPLF